MMGFGWNQPNPIMPCGTTISRAREWAEVEPHAVPPYPIPLYTSALQLGACDMKRHIVCLTFDHDHLSGFIARGLTSPTAISRGEYDMVVIPRLVALLARYDIKTTFFTPGHTIDSTPQAVMPYIEAGHELAHHGWTHRMPVTLSRDEEEEEIVRGNNSIK